MGNILGYFGIPTWFLECVLERKNSAHGKTNEELKKVSSYGRQLRNWKSPHPGTTRKKQKQKQKRQSHVCFLFCADPCFGSQDLPANNSVSDSPRTQTNQRAPSYSSTAQATLLWVRREMKAVANKLRREQWQKQWTLICWTQDTLTEICLHFPPKEEE